MVVDKQLKPVHYSLKTSVFCQDSISMEAATHKRAATMNQPSNSRLRQDAKSRNISPEAGQTPLSTRWSYFPMLQCVY
jgi:hypothetical protein